VPDLLAESVYGLPEVNRAAIKGARIVGNPGCYPTAVQLGFLPLLEAGVVDAAHLVADCKSGVSGAGRKAEMGLLFAEASDNFRAYSVKGHRHHPEISQGLDAAARSPVSVIFMPHLVPMIRGIYAPSTRASPTRMPTCKRSSSGVTRASPSSTSCRRAPCRIRARRARPTSAGSPCTGRKEATWRWCWSSRTTS
jgi:N-acetyl-gamma-glutamylphosphate reductase